MHAVDSPSEPHSAMPTADCPLPVLQEDWPLLVIVPASLRLVWAEELERWLPHLRPSGIHVITGKDDRLCALPEGGRRQQLPQVSGGLTFGTSRS
jgi:SNF2 family DNA or RNA helicase